MYSTPNRRPWGFLVAILSAVWPSEGGREGILVLKIPILQRRWYTEHRLASRYTVELLNTRKTTLSYATSNYSQPCWMLIISYEVIVINGVFRIPLVIKLINQQCVLDIFSMKTRFKEIDGTTAYALLCVQDINWQRTTTPVIKFSSIHPPASRRLGTETWAEPCGTDSGDLAPAERKHQW